MNGRGGADERHYPELRETAQEGLRGRPLQALGDLSDDRGLEQMRVRRQRPKALIGDPHLFAELTQTDVVHLVPVEAILEYGGFDRRTLPYGTKGRQAVAVADPQ